MPILIAPAAVTERLAMYPSTPSASLNGSYYGCLFRVSSLRVLRTVRRFPLANDAREHDYKGLGDVDGKDLQVLHLELRLHRLGRVHKH